LTVAYSSALAIFKGIFWQESISY